MSTSYKIRRQSADVVLPDASDEAVTIALTDSQVNGLLRGIIITVPSMSATQAVNKTENVTVGESIGILRS